jgi:hypothetical protein
VTHDESIIAGAPFAGDHEPRSPADRSGEHRLMLAILEDAIAVFVKSLSGRVTQREGCAAGAWLRSREGGPFTFECICEALGFDAGSIRRGVWALHAHPVEVSSRLSRRRHPGRLPVPGARTGTVREIAPHASVANDAPARRASGSPLAG